MSDNTSLYDVTRENLLTKDINSPMKKYQDELTEMKEKYGALPTKEKKPRRERKDKGKIRQAVRDKNAKNRTRQSKKHGTKSYDIKGWARRRRKEKAHQAAKYFIANNIGMLKKKKGTRGTIRRYIFSLDDIDAIKADTSGHGEKMFKDGKFKYSIIRPTRVKKSDAGFAEYEDLMKKYNEYHKKRSWSDAAKLSAKEKRRARKREAIGMGMAADALEF